MIRAILKKIGKVRRADVIKVISNSINRIKFVRLSGLVLLFEFEVLVIIAALIYLGSFRLFFRAC